MYRIKRVDGGWDLENSQDARNWQRKMVAQRGEARKGQGGPKRVLSNPKERGL